MITLSFAYMVETFATAEGLNVTVEGMDDVTAFGAGISSDKTFKQFAQQHSAPYNYQIVDGNPIRLVRRAVNDALVIDVEIAEADCIRRGKAPAVSFSRVDPSSLPLQVEIQYIDPVRNYATSTQIARHPAAPRTNTKLSVSIDFVISAQQARDMAFDLLYRLWAQQLQLGFEHPDMRIEPGDTFRLTCTKGVFVCIVVSQTLNMPQRTNSIKATILLASKGQTIAAAQADPFYILPAAFTMAGAGTASFVGSFGNAFTSSGQSSAAFVGLAAAPFTMSGIGSASFAGGNYIGSFTITGSGAASF